MPNETEREVKISHLCEMVKETNSEEAQLDKLVALSMQTGYDLGKLSKQQ